MTVKEFWSSKEKLAIHCDTEEKANKLLAKFDEIGKRWDCDNSYLSFNNYRNHGKETCYTNKGTFGDKDYYKREGTTVIEFDDLDDFKSSFVYLIFAKLGLKPNEEFKLNDGTGNIYFIDERLRITRKNLMFGNKYDVYIGDLLNGRYKISKLQLMTGKFVCIKSEDTTYTVGKIYEFKDGYTKHNSGFYSRVYESLEDYRKRNFDYDFIPLVED